MLLQMGTSISGSAGKHNKCTAQLTHTAKNYIVSNIADKKL